MKHNIKITIILIAMFFITQLIGLAVVYMYNPVVQQVVVNGTIQNVTINPLPYGMEPPQIDKQASFFSIVIAFTMAILFIFLLTKLKAAMFIRIWFFVVVVIVLGITFNAPLSKFIHYSIYSDTTGIQIKISSLISLVLALPLAIYKIFKRNLIVHNLTELLIYPGIAVVFIPLLSIWTVILLLLLISVYDMWAVWHSGFMQKMAKFQMNELKLFAGFFIPYLSKKQRELVKQAKADMKMKKKKSKKMKPMKVNLAILGGGDVVFPIITSGIIFRAWGLLPALIVIVCATLALSGLFILAKKGKFYPAMPFITAGLLIGIGLAYLINLFF